MSDYGLVPYCRQASIWPKANIYLWHKATYDAAMTQDTPSRSLDKVIVRLPDGMRERIREVAEKNNRSMNAEIVARLDQSFEAPDITYWTQQLDRVYSEVIPRYENLIKMLTEAIDDPEVNERRKNFKAFLDSKIDK